MGSFHSKILPSSDNVPIADQCVELSTDPRSPTLNINRSPINSETVISCAPVTKVKDLTTVLTDHGVLQTPNNLLPKRFQSIIDPRSPSTFDRTPLVVDTDSAMTDCSLTNVVSSLQFDEASLVAQEDTGDASFKDCDSEMLPNFCNLQIECDEKTPILEERNPNEVTVFEDAEVIPYAGNDPRSPCIAIARTPMVLGKEDEESAQQTQVKSGDLTEEELKRVVENQQRTPKHPIQDSSRQGDQTPKKDKLSAAKAGGARTPLGCMTNTGAGTNIRKLALIGHMKQSIATDEQKLITRSPNIGSAETMAGAKHISRSRIPKLRLS
ncbi:uncharacterized protein LOC131216661 [Anopheles bellator]|uniref:uncharacterized protein LOC131216661 n=1 Tax=Anopheles bellator TaxID=139047 RepID=UPI0026490136|nr:uncharacterized protein LOC131216661 [Anopheles bellator]